MVVRILTGILRADKNRQNYGVDFHPIGCRESRALASPTAKVEDGRMISNELLIRQLQRGRDAFLSTFAKVPSDKIDWQPDPSLRSVLNQFQQVATLAGHSWSLFTDRKTD